MNSEGHKTHRQSKASDIVHQADGTSTLRLIKLQIEFSENKFYSEIAYLR